MLFSQGKIEYLAVFLGNPGLQYENTRHNAGFMSADAMSDLVRTPISRLKFSALTGRCTIGGHGVLLMKPQTYMNLSGRSVREAGIFYKIPVPNIIVVTDDITRPFGTIRIRAKGSAGGHNGLKSIIECLGDDGFPRVKIGVGEPPREEYDTVDWVLSKFTGRELDDMRSTCKQAAEAVVSIIEAGAETAIGKFNSNKMKS